MYRACPTLSGAPDDQNYDFKYVCQSVSNAFLCNLEFCFVNLVLPLNLNYLFGILRVTDVSYQKFEEME